jgi:hypothetical protein
MNRYRDVFLNRVLAPEGEILSFAPPKKSIQRKCGPIAAHVLRSSHLSGGGRMLPAHLPPSGIHAAPLRAVPDKYCGARRGKREKSSLLHNLSYLLLKKYITSSYRIMRRSFKTRAIAR